jgi:hypothetical protein
MASVRSAWLAACLLAAFAAVPTHAQTPGRSSTSIATASGKPTPLISGFWKITAVLPSESGDPHPVKKNDPVYMGAVLEVSEAWMAWRPQKKDAGQFGDVCMTPRIVGGALKCEYGSFGPKDAKILYANGMLAIDWYGDAKLVLVRTD